jgi:tetratricopeptide (TPR) repeat protein
VGPRKSFSQAIRHALRGASATSASFATADLPFVFSTFSAPARLAACGAFLAALGLSGPTRAEDPEQAYRTASEQISNASQDAGAVDAAVSKHTESSRAPQQRIAEAVLLMGVKDYDRASDVLNEIVEQFQTHPTAYPDGLSLLGETYFLSKQYLAARRVFMKFIEQGNDPRFAPYREQAAIRVVDIALRLREFSSLDKLFTLVGSLGGEATSGLAYARGKGLLVQGKLDAADASLRNVAPDSAFLHQAKYLVGVAAMARVPSVDPKELAKDKTGAATRAAGLRYDQAVERFRDVVKLSPDTAEHRHVIDMAWLAIGRLRYEAARFPEAAEAYNHIDRTSPEFGTMLYELAWVYVKTGDFMRAQRALEVLAIAAPNGQDVADASLLRADLMLRAGQFEKSRKVYESVRASYETMRDKVTQFMASTKDPSVYFDMLSSEQLETFESGNALPTMALKWAREGDDGATAFAVIDDVVLSRRLVKESNEMIERLNAVLASPNKIRAIPGLRLGAERGLGLVNALALARMKLGQGLEGVESENLTSELTKARLQRKALEERLGVIPVTAADFATRDSQAKRQWNKASQELKRIELEVDTIQATVNGLERVLSDGPAQGVVRSAQELESYKSGLDEQKKLVAQYRSAAVELRRIIEAAKLQVGFGDKRFLEDEQVRKQYAAALWREVKLSEQNAGGAELAAYARRASSLLSKADDTELQVEGALKRLYDIVSAKVSELRGVVQKETQNIVSYSIALESLDKEARLVVGGVAMRNFGAVRDRLRNIVLRADVGITEEAWEVREEQQTRVRRLKVEKARTESRLQEELDEVLDDSGEGEQESKDGQ